MKSHFFSGGVALFLMLVAGASHAEQLSLIQVLTDAYKNNPSLEAERAKLRVRDEQVSLALSHWRPTVEATSGVGKTYQRIPDQDVYGKGDFASSTTSYGVQVSQPIFRGFRTLKETEAAKKGVLSGRAQLQDAEQKLLLDTAKAYLEVLRDGFILEMERNNETVLQKKLEQTTVRAQKGDLTTTDIQQAESRLARAEATRLQTENALQSSRMTFARLVGYEPGVLTKPELPSDGLRNLEDTVHLAEKHNPSVVSAQFSLEQADAEVDYNKGSLLPEVSLVGNVSRTNGASSSIPGRSDTGTVMLQMKIPLYEAGSDHARIRAAQQTSVQHRMELEDARHRAHELVQSSWKAFLVNESSIKVYRREIEASAKALDGVRVQAKVGTRTTLDELNAEQELLDAQKSLARAEYERNISLLQIKFAIGELTAESLKLSLDPYDPQKHYDDNHALWVGFGGADKDIYAGQLTREAK